MKKITISKWPVEGSSFNFKKKMSMWLTSMSQIYVLPIPVLFFRIGQGLKKSGTFKSHPVPLKILVLLHINKIIKVEQ